MEIEIEPIVDPSQHTPASGNTAVLAAVAGLIIGGPLLGLMGISFAAATTLLLVTSPLLILFGPVLFGAACVFALALLGFAAAGAMSIAGVSAVAWVLRPVATYRRSEWLPSGGGAWGVSGKPIGGGGLEEERRTDWAGHIQQNPGEDILINSG